MENLKNLVVQLDKSDCRFVIVGGFGVAALGCSLLTRNLEMACDMSPENLSRAWQALEQLHPVHRMTPARLPFTREQAESGTLKNLYLATDLGQIDLLGEIKGIGSFEECLKNSEPVVIDGAATRILTLDALILAKRAMGRPKDLHAVLELEVIRERRQRNSTMS
ncbi:MAG: nucleotidyltransferase [Verrucomicrobiaceae bacterium]|nr:MAG: nucleotidyltransferase [Verrucomicrobiaceae bacterium]